MNNENRKDGERNIRKELGPAYSTRSRTVAISDQVSIDGGREQHSRTQVEGEATGEKQSSSIEKETSIASFERKNNQSEKQDPASLEVIQEKNTEALSKNRDEQLDRGTVDANEVRSRGKQILLADISDTVKEGRNLAADDCSSSDESPESLLGESTVRDPQRVSSDLSDLRDSFNKLALEGTPVSISTVGNILEIAGASTETIISPTAVSDSKKEFVKPKKPIKAKGKVKESIWRTIDRRDTSSSDGEASNQREHSTIVDIDEAGEQLTRSQFWIELERQYSEESLSEAKSLQLNLEKKRTGRRSLPLTPTRRSSVAELIESLIVDQNIATESSVRLKEQKTATIEPELVIDGASSKESITPLATRSQLVTNGRLTESREVEQSHPEELSEVIESTPLEFHEGVCEQLQEIANKKSVEQIISDLIELDCAAAEAPTKADQEIVEIEEESHTLIKRFYNREELAGIGDELIETIDQTDTRFTGRVSELSDQLKSERRPLIEYSDSEEELESFGMAYTTPVTFRGTSHENASTWWRHASWWLSTTRAGVSGDLRQQLHQIAVLFQDEAQNWFAGLHIGRSLGSDSTAIRTIEQFEEAFLARFRRAEADRTGDVAALIQMKQTGSQPVEDFVTMIRRQGGIIGATEAEMFMAVVTGLKQDIKGQIMQFDPTSLEEVVKRGKIAERYPLHSMARISMSDTGASQEKLDKIMTAVNELNTRTSGKRPSTPPGQIRTATPPPRVRFAETSREQEIERQNWRSPSPRREYQGREALKSKIEPSNGQICIGGKKATSIK